MNHDLHLFSIFIWFIAAFPCGLIFLGAISARYHKEEGHWIAWLLAPLFGAEGVLNWFIPKLGVPVFIATLAVVSILGLREIIIHPSALD